MPTSRSPAILVYRRASRRFDPLRELLERNDFHPVVPPDAIAEWEYGDDRGTRVRYWDGTLLVECDGPGRADEFDRVHRCALPSDRDLPDGGREPERVDALAGSDESGKGERDRAIAVASVLVPRDREEEAIARGVRDSKSCSSAEVAELARWIAREFEHRVEVIGARARAESLRAHGGNETRLLASMHVACLRDLHARRPFALARVDRFAPDRPVAAAFREAIVDECVRGERHVACAAASILARVGVLTDGAWHVPGSARH